MSFDVPGGFISVMSPVYPSMSIPSHPPDAPQSTASPQARDMTHAYTHPLGYEPHVPQHVYGPQASYPQQAYSFLPDQHDDRGISPPNMPEHPSAQQGPYAYPEAHNSDNSLPYSDPGIEELYYNGPTSQDQHTPRPEDHHRPSLETFSSTPPLLYYAQLHSQHQVKTHGFRAGVRRGLEKAHIHIHKKSIGEALAHNASLASTVPVPVGLVGSQSTPTLDSSCSQPRSSPNVTSSALKPNFHKTASEPAERPDPNYCRMRDCGRPLARIPSLGGYIEWCGYEHMKEGMQLYKLKACKQCRTNPRRWDDRYCCPACER